RSGALAQQEIQAAHAHAPAPLRGPDVGDAGRLWNRILHYWGRGFLGARARGEVAERLAGVLARRITVDHLLALDTPERADAERYLRRLRFEALLTVRDARSLRTALARVLPSLEVHRERAWDRDAERSSGAAAPASRPAAARMEGLFRRGAENAGRPGWPARHRAG